MLTAPEVMIHDMVSVIVKQVQPEAIILFGSRATGSAGHESDVDLMVIESEPFGSGNDRRREMTRLWRALAKFPVSKDVLVYSQDEVEKWRGSRNHIIARALREGRLVYGTI